ncbi:MAG: hypothetical protein EOM03_12525, partial [Clostridia bacterium]|nr:hypothetical protein [Clostridia bacterium]
MSRPRTVMDLYLDLIRRLFPPQAVLHVGIGSGQGELAAWLHWDNPQGLVIDMDPMRLSWTDEPGACPSGVVAESCLVAGGSGPKALYRASNPDESGLYSPDKLAPYWSNLRTVGETSAQAITLDGLLLRPEHNAFKTATRMWILIDCLPAEEILHGSMEALKRTDMIVVRTIKEDQGIRTQLQKMGFLPLDFVEGNHPQIGHVVYIRHDPTVSSRDTVQARDEQTKLASDRLAQIQQLTAERDSVAAEKAQLAQARD